MSYFFFTPSNSLSYPVFVALLFKLSHFTSSSSSSLQDFLNAIHSASQLHYYKSLIDWDHVTKRRDAYFEFQICCDIFFRPPYSSLQSKSQSWRIISVLCACSEKVFAIARLMCPLLLLLHHLSVLCAKCYSCVMGLHVWWYIFASGNKTWGLQSSFAHNFWRLTIVVDLILQHAESLQHSFPQPKFMWQDDIMGTKKFVAECELLVYSHLTD